MVSDLAVKWCARLQQGNNSVLWLLGLYCFVKNILVREATEVCVSVIRMPWRSSKIIIVCLCFKSPHFHSELCASRWP